MIIEKVFDVGVDFGSILDLFEEIKDEAKDL